MRHTIWIPVLLASGCVGSPSGVRPDTAVADDAAWTAEFAVEPGELASTGRNPFFILEPGYRLLFEHGARQLEVLVLDETRTVDGVETRVVEERETEDGQPIEVSRNYFAISRRTGSVFYFGEDVDIFEDGKLAAHEGAWLSGEKGARFGLIMPGQPRLKDRYYQEIAPGVAMDRAEVVSLDATVKTPAGGYKACLRTQETTPLEPGSREFKHYAPGIGLVQDGSMKLVRHGRVESRAK